MDLVPKDFLSEDIDQGGQIKNHLLVMIGTYNGQDSTTYN